MKELSLNVLDLAQNSIAAGARRIWIDVAESEAENKLEIAVGDDGAGMDPEQAARAADPFFTTRKTRRVGLGLALFRQEAEQSGGFFELESEKGRGTRVRAAFRLDSIDRPPLGDMAATLAALVQGAPDIDFTYRRKSGGGGFELSTAELRRELGGVSLAEPEVLRWIREYVAENEARLSGGRGPDES